MNALRIREQLAKFDQPSLNRLKTFYDTVARVAKDHGPKPKAIKAVVDAIDRKKQTNADLPQQMAQEADTIGRLRKLFKNRSVKTEDFVEAIGDRDYLLFFANPDEDVAFSAYIDEVFQKQEPSPLVSSSSKKSRISTIVVEDEPSMVEPKKSTKKKKPSHSPEENAEKPKKRSRLRKQPKPAVEEIESIVVKESSPEPLEDAVQDVEEPSPLQEEKNVEDVEDVDEPEPLEEEEDEATLQRKLEEAKDDGDTDEVMRIQAKLKAMEKPEKAGKAGKAGKDWSIEIDQTSKKLKSISKLSDAITFEQLQIWSKKLENCLFPNAEMEMD